MNHPPAPRKHHILPILLPPRIFSTSSLPLLICYKNMHVFIFFQHFICTSPSLLLSSPAFLSLFPPLPSLPLLTSPSSPSSFLLLRTKSSTHFLPTCPFCTSTFTLSFPILPSFSLPSYTSSTSILCRPSSLLPFLVASSSYLRITGDSKRLEIFPGNLRIPGDPPGCASTT